MSSPRSNTRNQTVGAFVLNNDATYVWTIFVHVPSPDGGAKRKTKFKAEFRHCSPERRLEILEDFREKLRERDRVATAVGGNNEDDTVAMKDMLTYDRMLLDEALVGFREILDKDGNDVPATEENKALLLSNSWARDALLMGYAKSLEGRSAEGN